MTLSRFTRRAVSRRGLIAGAAGAGVALSARSAGFAAPNLLQGLSGSIVVSYPDTLGVKPRFVEEAAEAVRAANPDATVNVQRDESGDAYTRLLLAIDSGNAPDVIHTGGGSIGELADAGYIEPLDAYVAEWEDWQFYPDSVKAGVTYDGSVYAIPYGLDVRFLYVRRDILEQAGLSRDWEPANLAGILEAAAAIKEAGIEGVAPYVLYAGEIGGGGTTEHAFRPLVTAYGGAMIDADGKWIASSDAYLQALEYYQEAFINLQLVPGEVLTSPSPWTAARQSIGEGRLGLLFEGGWVYGGYVTNVPDQLDEIAYLLHPTVDAGPSFTMGGPGTCWYISSSSENKELAWEFIKAFNTRDIVANINIEDPHPVARTDSAEVPEFAANPFLVASTEAVSQAVFSPVDANWNAVQRAVQVATGLVAAGEATPEEGLERLSREIVSAVGEENVSA